MRLSEWQCWLDSHLPEVANDLRAPALDANLHALESCLGVQLPPDMRSLYRWHDGQRAADPDHRQDPLRRPGLIWGLAFLSIAQVTSHAVEARTMCEELGADALSSLDQDITARPEGAVRPVYLHRGWLPLAHDGGGNYVGVDLDPGPRGRPGHVIVYGRDEPVRWVLAQSVSAWVDATVGMLAAGQARIQRTAGDSVHFGLARPPVDHWFEAIAGMGWPGLIASG